MGVDLETARFLLARRREGARFGHCATLGRQHFYVSSGEVRRMLREFGLSPAEHRDLVPSEYPGPADAFWRMLGAHTVHSIDASDFEGATHVHDLNRPVPDSWREAYDVVCDCGTLEHVFDFPTAIRNCLEMVNCGGHFFAQTPANNYLGHGFYQFSPELFFRVLSPVNGFELERCVAVEYGLRRRWFEVTDPEVARARVTLINTAPVTLFVWARRTSIQPLFTKPLQQSDYASAWAERTSRPDPNPSMRREPWNGLKRFLLTRTPRLARVVDSLRFSRFSRRFSFRNPSYRRVSGRGDATH
jgi:hypothetical protein